VSPINQPSPTLLVLGRCALERGGFLCVGFGGGAFGFGFGLEGCRSAEVEKPGHSREEGDKRIEITFKTAPTGAAQLHSRKQMKLQEVSKSNQLEERHVDISTGRPVGINKIEG
jgi:hypothetical protein